MAKQTYAILSQKDDNAKSSVTGRRQRVIRLAWKNGGGQLTSTQIAEAAEQLLRKEDDDTEVSSVEVGKYAGALKKEFPEHFKKMPTIKQGVGKGKTALARASASEMDDFLEA